MKQPNSYSHCYTVLNADENCSWHDLRKSYRTLIQKWHPDKYQNEKEKSYATDKLKELNIAYKHLSDHHSAHGVLPQSTPEPRQPTPSPPLNKENFSSPKIAKRKTAKTTTIKKKKITLRHIFTYSAMSVVIIIIYQGINHSFAPSSLSITEKSILNKKKILQNKQNRKRKIKAESKIEYFTYGSTLGEIIMIQGPPDRVVNNIWFYGKSEIHFKDGLVTKWLRSANTPLKAQAILIPEKKNSNTDFR